MPQWKNVQCKKVQWNARQARNKLLFQAGEFCCRFHHRVGCYEPFPRWISGFIHNDSLRFSLRISVSPRVLCCLLTEEFHSSIQQSSLFSTINLLSWWGATRREEVTRRKYEMSSREEWFVQGKSDINVSCFFLSRARRMGGDLSFFVRSSHSSRLMHAALHFIIKIELH